MKNIDKIDSKKEYIAEILMHKKKLNRQEEKALMEEFDRECDKNDELWRKRNELVEKDEKEADERVKNEYKNQLEKFKTLPFWKRLILPKPNLDQINSEFWYYEHKHPVPNFDYRKNYFYYLYAVCKNCGDKALYYILKEHLISDIKCNICFTKSLEFDKGE